MEDASYIRLEMNDDGKEAHIFRMPPSSANGHFQTVLHVPIESDQIDLAKQQQHLKTISLQVVMGEDDTRRFEGTCYVLNEKGLSVISDIDDTIKISNVTSKQLLLKNTFLEEFEPVPGMAKLFAQWESDYQAAFHYVSSSPWQLYPELESFRERYHFPKASFHLKSIRPKDRTILNLFADPVITKTAEITRLVNRFPQRHFVLVGDAGERDPEIYGALARKYPNQIVAILIRDLSTVRDLVRYRAAFADVPGHLWMFFRDPEEIQLPRRMATAMGH